MARRHIGLGMAAAALLACAASASALTLNPGFFGSDLIVTAEDGVNPGLDEVIRNPLAVPYQTTESAVDGPAGAGASFDLWDAGFQMDFDLTSPGGGSFGYGESLIRIYFEVDAAVDYQILGSYDAVDPDAGRAEFGVDLQDVTGGTTLFLGLQESLVTPDESFVVGGAGGDTTNLLAGSAIGTLLPGREYSFLAYARLGSQGDGLPGTVSGFARLVLVPEPATALLLASGLLALAARRRARPR
jgi:hypothetical protein